MEEDSTTSFLENVLKDDVEKKLIQLFPNDDPDYDKILEEILPLVSVVKK
jgi:hypothetical protein